MRLFAGWLLAICLLALLTIVVPHGQNFSSKKTTPSRAASFVEIAIGCLLLAFAALTYRRRRREGRTGSPPQTSSPPKWLDHLGRTNWLIGIAVGAAMLTYSITVVAAAEILKAKVETRLRQELEFAAVTKL